MPAAAPDPPTTSAGGSAQRSVRSGSWEAPKSSAYKGVSWHKHSQKWYAYIQVRTARSSLPTLIPIHNVHSSEICTVSSFLEDP